MQIQIVWPERPGRVALLPHHNVHQPLCFDVITGQFSEQRLADASQTLFWLRHQRLMIGAEAQEYVCRVEGQPLALGETLTLQVGARIQAGQFLLEVCDDPAEDGISHLLPIDETIPDLASLINHGGHYTPYREAAGYVSEGLRDDDPLKSLAQEYKHYLLWGEQQNIARDNQPHNTPAPERFSDSLHIQDEIKNKTVSECVIDNSVMMARIFKDLMIDAQDLPEDEAVISVELLRELAPEHLKQIEKRAVSELVYRELYKLGLDSHL